MKMIQNLLMNVRKTNFYEFHIYKISHLKQAANPGFAAMLAKDPNTVSSFQAKVVELSSSLQAVGAAIANLSPQQQQPKAPALPQAEIDKLVRRSDQK